MDEQEPVAGEHGEAGGGADEPAMIDEVTHRFGGPEDEPAIQELFEDTFGVRRSSEEWRWRFVDAPLAPNLHLIELDGRLVGHMAFARFPTYLDGERDVLLSGGDWMYRPEVRRKGVGRKFYSVYADTYGDLPVSLGFPSADAQAVAERSPGGRKSPLFELPQWVRWHSGHGLHRSNPQIPVPVGHVLAAGATAVAALGQRRSRTDRRVERRWADPEALDELAERLRQLARCVRVRDGAYVDWRWHRQPDRSWWMHTCTDTTGRLTGWAVAGLDPTAPGTGRIVDLLVEDPATLTALLDAAHQELGRHGAELSSCELLDQRPWARRAVQRAGFLHRPGGPLASASQPRPGKEGWTEPTAWYLTRGDTDFA